MSRPPTKAQPGEEGNKQTNLETNAQRMHKKTNDLAFWGLQFSLLSLKIVVLIK